MNKILDHSSCFIYFTTHTDLGEKISFALRRISYYFSEVLQYTYPQTVDIKAYSIILLSY